MTVNQLSVNNVSQGPRGLQPARSSGMYPTRPHSLLKNQYRQIEHRRRIELPLASNAGWIVGRCGLHHGNTDSSSTDTPRSRITRRTIQNHAVNLIIDADMPPSVDHPTK